jgi:hypothetical protein
MGAPSRRGELVRRSHVENCGVSTMETGTQNTVQYSTVLNAGDHEELRHDKGLGCAFDLIESLIAY